MRLVIQRVSSGSVTIDSIKKAEIQAGLVILLGVTHHDTEQSAIELAKKVVHLRIMADEQQKMNKSILDVGGSIIVVSQFSLYADTSGGRRPSFVAASPVEHSKPLYELFVEELKRLGVKDVQTGEFGTYMDVKIHNDGPVTIVMEG